MRRYTSALLLFFAFSYAWTAGAQVTRDGDGDGIRDVCECGDASGDGRVNSTDARLIQRCSVGQFPCPALCDVSGDGSCNSIDARLVQRFAVGVLGKTDLRCVERPAGFAPQACLAGLPAIEIASPLPGAVLAAGPVRVQAEVRHRFAITEALVNGAPQDLSGQVLLPGDGQTTADEYVLAIDTTLDLTDVAADIAGETTGVDSFDPGSNRVIVSARDDLGKRGVRTHIFAVGEVTPLGPPFAADLSAATAPSFEGEVSDAFAFGVDPPTLDDRLREACDTLGPVLDAFLRNAAQRCDGGGKDGETCAADTDCDGGGTCAVPEFAPSQTLALETGTACDPTVSFGIHFENTRLDSIACSTRFEAGVLTLVVEPRIRALNAYVRGECGICVDLDPGTLESVAVGVDLELGIDLPAIQFQLLDWQNAQPIDPADPAWVRFLEESLSTAGIEKAIVVEARVRDFLPHPQSSAINQALLDLVVTDPALRDAIDAQLNPASEVVAFVRGWLASQAAGFAETKLEEKLAETTCDSGPDEGEPCEIDDDCAGAGACVPAVEPVVVDRIREQLALQSFRTDSDGIAISVKAKLSPALIDPEIQATPGALRTPAAAPLVGSPDAGVSFAVIADDAFNQIFATLTALGDIQERCFPPMGEETPKTLGDLLGDCPPGPGGAGNGLCVGVRGGDCNALATPADRGSCVGVRGGDCGPFDPFTDPVARASCEGTPELNLSGDMPLLYCGRADVPPSLWIQDDVDPLDGQPVTTPDQIETHLRLNDLALAIVVDRNADASAQDRLGALPYCVDPTSSSAADCRLIQSCLDLNFPTSVVVTETPEGEPTLGVGVQGVQRLGRPAGTACAGGPSFGQDPLGVERTFGELVDAHIAELNEKVPDVPLALPAPFPFADPQLIALRTTEAQAGFDDYLGFVSTPPQDACGNGSCDAGEACGYDNPGSCAADCGLCEPGAACNARSDCDTDRCLANVCQSPAFAQLNDLSCDGDCLFEADCLGGVCNLGFCERPNSLEALSPCSTGRACRSESCRNGLCEQICGDGFCDGTEKCGANNVTLLQCRTDCGQCPDGEPCADDAMCQSGICNALVCVSPLPNGSLCAKDAACASGVCNLGLCTAPNSRPALAPCSTSAACRSQSCSGNPGVCQQVCGDGFCDGTEICGADNSGLRCRADCSRCPNGTPCTSDATCQSGNCRLGFCRAPCTSNGGICAIDANCCSGDCRLGRCQ